jgi:Rrf2 family protein
MIQLASVDSGTRMSLPELARAAEAPGSFLSKVLQALARSGMICSRRGQSGGFQISERGRRASMLQVIEAIEGVIRLNACLVSGKSCRRKSWCPAHPVWAQAQHAMLSILDGVTIAELSARPPRESEDRNWSFSIPGLVGITPLRR